MAFEARRTEGIDYRKCRYPGSKLTFRGPKRSVADKHLAFVGSSETFGKFVARPFVDRVEAAMGVPCFNFGQMNAGPDVFLNEPAILDICGQAETTVVQVFGAHNMSNRFYRVHPRRNDRFLKASDVMRSVFSEIDFTEFTFTKHMLLSLHNRAPNRLMAVQLELQMAWVARMRYLAEQISGRKVLLWVGRRSPDMAAEWPGDGIDPMFVTREMIDDVRASFEDVVEVVVDRKLDGATLDGMQFQPVEVDSAREMFGPNVHQAISNSLLAVLK